MSDPVRERSLCGMQTHAGKRCTSTALEDLPCCHGHTWHWAMASNSNARAFVAKRAGHVVGVRRRGRVVWVKIRKCLRSRGHTTLHLSPQDALVIADELAGLGDAEGSLAVLLCCRELGVH